MNPWLILAEIAKAEADRKVREETRNDSERIRSYWRECADNRSGWREQLPWCAAFVSWCVRRASETDDRLALTQLPSFASVRNWLSWCFACALRVAPREAQAGDLVIYLPRVSHIGIVYSVDERREFVTVIEGNTSNGKGLEREGDGVFVRFRALAECGTVWRLPCRPSRLAAVVAPTRDPFLR